MDTLGNPAYVALEFGWTTDDWIFLGVALGLSCIGELIQSLLNVLIFCFFLFFYFGIYNSSTSVDYFLSPLNVPFVEFIIKFSCLYIYNKKKHSYYCNFHLSAQKCGSKISMEFFLYCFQNWYHQKISATNKILRPDLYIEMEECKNDCRARKAIRSISTCACEDD